ncbi:Hypothetical Protein FCC1311_010442 [Hondaea fermentalgiana]|uniref:VOC domain-containing protein n=1 Tax=Hondaea fermentalgiana TaxID=2315210 RepID=A0A2R5G1C4_9STRA|nr:Hypothetical Protein FCC1311_010442 [Hondaea fermentalgiana]|eukprot:GBG24826.1 Hypothetical Protein FCC1311_010442 [Hondaea fermentalgiana]
MTSQEHHNEAQAPLLLLEHLNLNIPDVDLAREFYVSGLRCKENVKQDRTRLLHVNLGLSQMHLPHKIGIKVEERKPVLEGQVVHGFIDFGTKESLESLAHRLENLDTLRGKIKVEPLAGQDVLHVRGPFGNHFRIAQLSQAECAQIEAEGSHPCGSDMMLALRRVVLFCPRQSSKAIADFYSKYLACQTRRSASSCEVLFSKNQVLEFVESDEAPPANAYDLMESQRFHVALYVSSEERLLNAYHRAAADDLVYVNPRFQGGPIEFASSSSEADVRKSLQFRLRDVPSTNSEASKAFQLEHEVRSPKHKANPLFASRL